MKLLLRILCVMAVIVGLMALLLAFSVLAKLAWAVLALMAIPLGILTTIFWIWMLVLCAQRMGRGEQDKTAWLIAVALTHIIGATIYYLVVERPARLQAGLAWVAGMVPVAAPVVASMPASTGTGLPNPGVVPPSPPKTNGCCPKCNAALPPDAPEGLCPRCLLQMNLGATTQFTGAAAGAPPPPPEEIAKHFPQLEILECLGRGGMGIVYKARQPRLNRFVALKILAPGIQHDVAFAERFLREAQALAKLNHPNIVTVYDFGESDGLYFLLMEYVDGVTLRGLLREGKVVPEQAMAIVPRICEALQYAHEQGVVHRDIKPENVLMDKQGRVKIADFGIARMLGVEGQPAYTRDRYVVGTPYYMAPEQVEKPMSVDHRADIYSLGVVFYEMLTGELPLGRFAIPSQKVQMDVRLDDVVLRALEKEPQLRYQHAGQVKTDVENISGVSTGASFVPPPPVVPPPAAPSPAENIPPATPHFSRLAILGMVWMILGGFILVAANAKPGDFFRGFNEPTPSIIAALMALLFVAMIFGWMAVGDIRRSGGRLCGLWLAVIEGLTFPLVVLDGLIFFLGFLIVRARFEGMAEVPMRAQAVYWLLCILLSLVADIIIFGLTWFVASRPVKGIPVASSRRNSWGLAGPVGLAFVLGAAALGVWTVNLPRTARITTHRNDFGASMGTVDNVTEVTTAAVGLTPMEFEKLNLQLTQAQAEGERLKPMVDQGLATQDEMATAQENVEVLQAQIRGDPVEVLLVKLDTAKKQLARKQQLHDVGLLNEADYGAAKNKVELLKLDLAQAQARHPQAVFTPTPLSSAALQSLNEQLQQAQQEVAQLTPLVAQGTASPDGLSRYQESVEVLQAQIANDPVMVAKANVKWAQKRVDDLIATNADHGDQYSNALDQLNACKQEVDDAQKKYNPSGGPTPMEVEKLNQQLVQAEAEVERLNPMVSRGLATRDDLNVAQGNVKVLQAQIKGDPIEIAKVKYYAAQERWFSLMPQYDAGLVPGAKYQEAESAADSLGQELFNRQQAAALAITDTEQRDRALATLVNDHSLAAIGRFDQKIQAAKRMTDSQQRDRALSNLAKSLTVDELEVMLPAINDPNARDQAAFSCAIDMGKKGHKEDAVKVANGIADPGLRASALAELAK